MGRSLPEKAAGSQAGSPLFKIAFVLVRLDHLASVIVNANNSTMRTAVELSVAAGAVIQTLLAQLENASTISSLR